MLQLTKQESAVFSALHEGPKTKYELEAVLDENKMFSESLIKVIVSNINRKAGKRIIEGFNEDGYYKYRLIDDRIEYKLAEGIEGALEELKEISTMNKSIKCETCKFKVDHDSRFKQLIIFIGIFVIIAMLVFIMGYNIGYNNGMKTVEPSIEIDKSFIEQIKNLTGTN